MMKLTVLGKYGPFPYPGGACSGYLVESGNIRIVLDMGSGTLSRLLQVIPSFNIDAILLSHLHSDHCSDMFILRYMLEQTKIRERVGIHLPISVVAPNAPEYEYRQLSASGVFDITATSDGRKMKIGDMSITMYRTIHPVPTYAYLLEHEGRSLFYTGDTGYFHRLKDYAANSSLLLADACLLSADKTTETASHLTAYEAGCIARDANVSKLICTHIWGGSYSEEPVLFEARKAFDRALVATEMQSYNVLNINPYAI